MEKPVLSVIIPFYKGMKYIKRTVEYVEKLKASKEILIIDDGSGDEDYNALKECYGDTESVRLFTKKNGGIVDARNFGSKLAVGDYLFFVDQDDIVVPEVIDKALCKAIDLNLDAVFWSTEMLFKEKRPNRKCDTVNIDVVLQQNAIREQVLKQVLLHSESEYCSSFAHLWMGLYRNSFIKEKDICFKAFINIEDDFLFLVDVMANANKLALIPEVGYYWFQNRSSKSHKSTWIENYMDKSDNYRKYCLDVARSVGYDEETLNKIERHYSQLQISDAVMEWTRVPRGTTRTVEKRRILSAMKEKEAKGTFRELLLGGDERVRITHSLIRKRHFELTFIYNKIWNYYFEFRKRAGAFIWGKLR